MKSCEYLNLDTGEVCTGKWNKQKYRKRKICCNQCFFKVNFWIKYFPNAQANLIYCNIQYV